VTRFFVGSKRLLPLACVIAVTLFPVLSAGQESHSLPEERARQLLEQYLQAYRARYPETADRSVGELFDNSRGAYSRWARTETNFLSRLVRIAGHANLASPEAVTLALLKERLEASHAFEECHRELWNVSPVTGWLSEYRGYAAQQPAGTPAQRSAALQRWRQLPSFIDTEIDNLRFGQRHGFSAPRMLVSATIAQLDRVLAAPTQESPFFVPALRDTSTDFRNDFETLVREKITPAIKRYRNFLAKSYLPGARETVGVAYNPGGRACFRALVRRYTSLPFTTAELDSMGRDLLRRGIAERTKARLPRDQLSSPKTLHLELIADSANGFRSTQQVMTYAADAIHRAWTVSPHWFGRLPAEPLPSIDSLPGADASDPTAQYVPASPGNPRSKILLNLSELLKPGAKLYLERVMFHEGVPGHHLQIALQQSSTVSALNRTLFSPAFVEGWAVYASNLADDMGLYTSAASRFPLVEALVDDGLTFIVQTGLHAHGWSREQAVDTMLVYSSDSRAELEQQVDYYIAAPGHALAYPVGARAIDRLRRDAMLQLGSSFDVRRFHDAVLANGPVPLTTLRGTITQWIARERTQLR